MPGDYSISIYTMCALFLSNSCACTGKIDEQTNLLELNELKRRRILQPKMPSSALEFDSLLQGALSFTNHFQKIITIDAVAANWGSITMMNNLISSSTIQFDEHSKLFRDNFSSYLPFLLILEVILFPLYMF